MEYSCLLPGEIRLKFSTILNFVFSLPYPIPGRFWDPQNFKSVTLGAQGSPITKMVSVGGRLWCGCQNRVLVLSPDTLQQEVAWRGEGDRIGDLG
jgi:hypothetical protein